ncbi:MAG: ATP-binding protein [Armatimonadota bacterium]
MFSDEPEALIRQILAGLGESISLEVKSCLDPALPEDELKLAKTIVSLANAFGGHLVVGITDQREGARLIGLKADVIKHYDVTTISRKIAKYVEPPVSLSVSLPSVNQVTCAIVTVEPYAQAPHRVLKDRHDSSGHLVLQAGSTPCRTVHGDIAANPPWNQYVDGLDRVIGNRIRQLKESGIIDTLPEITTRKTPPPNVKRLLVGLRDAPREFSFPDLFAAVIVKRLAVWGLQLSALEELAVWLRDPRCVTWILSQMSMGFGVHLYTNLHGCFDVTTEFDIGTYLTVDSWKWGPHVQMPLHELMNKFLVALNQEPFERTVVAELRPRPLRSSEVDCEKSPPNPDVQSQ